MKIVSEPLARRDARDAVAPWNTEQFCCSWWALEPTVTRVIPKNPLPDKITQNFFGTVPRLYLL